MCIVFFSFILITRNCIIISGPPFHILLHTLIWLSGSKRQSKRGKQWKKACSPIETGLVTVSWKRLKAWFQTEGPQQTRISSAFSVSVWFSIWWKQELHYLCQACVYISLNYSKQLYEPNAFGILLNWMNAFFVIITYYYSPNCC